MRLVHIHEKASFFGGVEQILHDTAQGLAGRGWEQALLHSANADTDFCAPFAQSATDPDFLGHFQPNVVLIHKPSMQLKINTISEQWPSLRMLHDHDLVCLRRHKYTPFSNQTCEQPAGYHCYTNLCFITRNRNSRLPIKLNSVAERKRDIALHQMFDRINMKN